MSIIAARVTRATRATPPKPDGQCRQDQRASAPRSGDGKPAELHREEQNHQQSEPKAGNRGSEQDDQHDKAIEPTILKNGRECTGADTHQRREGQREAAQRETVGQVLRDETRHRSAQDDSVAEIARQRILQPDQILNEQWLIEAVLGGERGLLFR